MPTVVKPEISSSYSSSSKYSSQVLSRGHRPKVPLGSSSHRHSNRAKAVSPVWQNSQAYLTQSRDNKHQETGESRGSSRIVPQTPVWLKFLVAVQQGSTPITFMLGVGVLIVYGWSVYAQRAWGKAYDQLGQLQREERQLTAASETRKHQLARQAESSTTGLVRQEPANVVFLEPEPSRGLQSPNLNQPIKGPAPASSVGY